MKQQTCEWNAVCALSTVFRMDKLKSFSQAPFTAMHDGTMVKSRWYDGTMMKTR
jgi:hypothetical protein